MKLNIICMLIGHARPVKSTRRVWVSEESRIAEEVYLVCPRCNKVLRKAPET